MKPVRRWFELLLRTFPGPFRDRHADAMRDAFEGAYADHRERGWLKGAAFLARTFVDLVVAGMAERLFAVRRRRSSRGAPGRALHGSGSAPASWLDVKLWYLLIAVSLGVALLGTVLLAMASSGIYAIMSFSVSERMREISVRAALGAGQRELIQAVARRALLQLAIGVSLGMPVALDFPNGSDGNPLDGAGTTLAAGIGVLVFVALAACTGPTLRALRVQPSEVLRSEG